MSEIEPTYKRINTFAAAKKRILWILLGFAVFWAALGILVLIFGDPALALALNPDFSEKNWIYWIVEIYTMTFFVIMLGSFLAIILVMAIPKAKPYRRTMLEVLFSLAFAMAFVESLKRIVGRIRPHQPGSGIDTEINSFGETTDSGSMPSGHVGYTTAGALPHAVWLKKVVWTVLISIYAAGMTYTRMFLGIHYMSDVLVGSVIGLGCTIASFFLFQLIYKKGNISRKAEWIIFAIGIILIVLTQFLVRGL